MGTSVSSSLSQSANPLSDIKPTLQDSPTDFFVNKTQNQNMYGSTLGETLVGDNLYGSGKSMTSLGNALTDSQINYNLSGGSSVIDGGAVMAMFNLASKAIDMNSPVSILQSLNKANGEIAGQNGDPVEDVISKIKDFITENKTMFVVGGLIVGYLIYKGVSK